MIGLALLDGDLRTQLNADEFLRTLEREVPKLNDALNGKAAFCSEPTPSRR